MCRGVIIAVEVTGEGEVKEAVVAEEGGEGGVGHDRGVGLYEAKASMAKHTIGAVPRPDTVHHIES